MSGHNAEKIWFEAFAKEILETVYPLEYRDMTMSDKPDIRMGDHGVEVTRALYPYEAEANHLFGLICNQVFDHENEKQRNTIRRLAAIGKRVDCNSSGKITIMGSAEGTYITSRELLDACINKEEKEYSDTGIVDLFIFSPVAHIPGWFDEETVFEFFESIGKSRFNSIFVYSGECLYRYKIKEGECSTKLLTNKQYEKCSRSAIEISGYKN